MPIQKLVKVQKHVLSNPISTCVYVGLMLSKNLLLFFLADLLLGLTDTVIHSIERTIGYMEFGVNLEGFDLIFIQNSVLCALQRGFSNTCQLASNFILCAASLDRALVVAKPMLNFRRG